MKRWMAEFGADRTLAICQHNQRIPNTVIRIDSPEIERELTNEGIELAPGALLASARIVKSGDITHTQAFREGRVFIQDEASQLVAALVGTGSRLLDCCAAPGGKTAALAARNPRAEIIAVELHTHRADLLRKRVHATNVKVINADALELPLQGGFDRVLADVPCSGTGTLARNPEIKWRLTPRTSAICMRGRSAFFGLRCNNSRLVGERCTRHARWKPRRMKRSSRKSCGTIRPTRCVTVATNWNASAKVKNLSGTMWIRCSAESFCTLFQGCIRAMGSLRQ